MLTSQVLERAANIMEARGKCAHAWIDEYTGACCIGGAIHLAGGGWPWDLTSWALENTAAWQAVARAIPAEYNVHSYNRIHDTKTVVATLRACAAVERARENKEEQQAEECFVG